MSDNPLPLACVALAIAVVPLGAGARRVAATLSEDDDLPGALAPGIALSVWLVAVHVVGLVAESFVWGLSLGTLTAAALGASAWRWLPPAPPRKPRVAIEIVGPILAAVVISPMALNWAFHDELLTTGHWALVSELQNGIYPPRYTTFPEIELRYHYGFNVLVAAVTAVTRVGVSLGIDIVTIACFAYSWRLCTIVGDRVAGRGKGTLAAALVLFGGGVPLLCDKVRPFTVSVALGQCNVDGVPTNPPVVSYFFQHAWTIGLPLALAAILICLDEKPLLPVARRAALGVIMVALALGQIVLFLTLSGAILAHETFAASALVRRGSQLAITLRASLGSVLRAVVTLALIAFVVTKLHGFFAPSPNKQTAIVPHLGVLPTLAGELRWHASTYGLAIPLGIAGLFCARSGRAIFASLAAGSLIIINVARYRLSWDIMKFATVASIALAMLAAAAMGRLLSVRPRWLGTPAAAILAISSLLAGAAYPIVFALNLDGIPLGNFFRASPEVTPADREVIAMLRRRAGRSESVYRTPPAVWGYAPWGGLAHPWPDGQAKVFLDPDHFFAREALLKSHSGDVDRWLAHRVRYMVLDPSDKALSAHAERWVAAGRAKQLAVVGPLVVYELSNLRR